MSSRANADPGVECSRCGEGFGELRDLALHRGRVHAGDLDAGEEASFEAAVDEERAWLASFRRHVRAALAAAAVIAVYASVVLIAYVNRADPAFMLLPLPGIVVFAAVTYFLTYRFRAGD